MAATYYAQILRDFNWELAQQRCRENAADVMRELESDGCTITSDGEIVGEHYDISDSLYGVAFLGTVFTIMPSGKYYMPWACSNVTESEATQDEAYMLALERAAEKHGGWVMSGEGDPCDLFFAMNITPREIES